VCDLLAENEFILYPALACIGLNLGVIPLGVKGHAHVQEAHLNNKYMKPGDYFIVDDTTPYTPTATGVGKIHSNYEGWGSEKLTRLRKFLSEHNKYYAVDSFFTDYFGYNGTSNWNGYIRRMC